MFAHSTLNWTTIFSERERVMKGTHRVVFLRKINSHTFLLKDSQPKKFDVNLLPCLSESINRSKDNHWIVVSDSLAVCYLG